MNRTRCHRLRALAGLAGLGADPAFLGADDFGKFLAAEMPRWAKAVKDSGARLD